MAGDRIQGLSIGMGLDDAGITRSMSEITRSMRGLNSEAKVTSNNFKFGKKDTDSYKKAIDQLTGTTEKQRKNVEDLGKRYAQTVEEQGASSKAAQKLATEYNKQADNLNRLENELGGMQNELSKLTEEQRIAESQWTKTGDAMEKHGGRLEKVGGGAQKVGGIFTAMSAAVVGGITGLTGGLFALTNKATEAADAIAKGSERMGISTDFYQEMDFWASQNGLSQNDLEKAVGRLNQRMGMALDGNKKYSTALERLGVDLEGVRDGTVSTEEAMAQSIQSLSEMENEHEKAALATEMFGTKLSRELLPALNDGSLSIEDAKEKAQELGLVMSEDQLYAAEAFQDAQDQIKRAMGAVATQIGLDLMPQFQKMLDWILERMPQIRETISNVFDNVVDKVKGVVNWWNGLSDTMKKIVPIIGGLALAFGPVLLIVGKVMSAVGGMMMVMGPLIKQVGAAGGIMKVLGSAFAVVTGPIGLTIAGIVALGAGFVLAYNKSATFRGFIDGIGEKISGAIGWLGDFKDGILGLFKDDGMEGVDILTSIGISQEMADNLWEFTGYFYTFRDKVVEVVEKVKGAFSGIMDFFKGDTEGGINLLQSIGLSDETIETIFEVVARIRRSFELMKIRINSALQQVGVFFKSIFNDLKSWWDTDGALIFESIRTVFENVFERIKIAADIGLKFVQNLFEIFAPIVEGIWNLLWPTMLFLIENVWEKIKLAIGIAMDLIQGIISGVAALIEGDWSRFGEILKETALSIKDRVTEFFGNMRDNALDLFNKLTGGAVDKFNELKDKVIGSVLGLVEKVVWEWERFKVLTELKIRTMVQNVKDFFSDLWTNTTQKATEIKDGVVNRFTELKDGAVNRIVGLYNSATSWFQNIYTSVRDKMLNAKNTAVGFATDLKDGAVEQFTKLSDGASDMMDKIGQWIDDKKSKIVNKAKNLGVDLANGAIGGFNKLIGGINGVAELLGHNGNLVTPIQTISSYSKGTNFHKGGAALVGDKGIGNGSGGSGTREIVELPNKKQYLVDGNVLFPDFPLGAKVFNNKDTENMLGGSGSDNWIQSSAKSIGNFTQKAYHGAKDTVSGAYNSVKGIVGDVWDYVKNPGDLVNKMISNLDLGFNLPSEALELASLGVNKLKSTITDFVTGLFETADGGGDGSHILGKQIYQRFGKYTGGLSFNDGNHFGLDTAHKHEALLSPINGVISRIWNDYGGGNSLQVDAGKHTWWFMHLSKILTSVGERIKAGQKIAVTGSTGNFVSGTGHLHTQVMEGGVGNAHAIDPLPILKNLKGFATGGLVGDGIYRLGEGGYPEYVIPTDPSRATEAMKLLALAGKDVGKSKRPGQLPNVSQGNDNNEIVNALVEQNGILMKMLEKLTGIEAKELVVGDEVIGKSNDRYNKRQSSIGRKNTGRLNYNV